VQEYLYEKRPSVSGGPTFLGSRSRFWLLVVGLGMVVMK
jgi:hypothetical protein